MNGVLPVYPCPKVIPTRTAAQIPLLVDQLSVIIGMLRGRNADNLAMHLEDLLAHHLFVSGYKMHDPSRTRADLTIPEVAELLKTCQL